MSTEQKMQSSRDYFNNSRPEMLKFLPGSARKILDIGCGNGAFSRLIKENSDAEIWGVELDADAAAIASESLYKVICGPVQQHTSELPHSYFDCIFMNDILEHLVDPWSVLESLREKLNPAGVIVASIPNVRHYKNFWNFAIRGDWSYVDAGTLDRTHLRFFTVRTMRQLFEEHGYKIVELHGLRPSKKFKVKLWKYISLGRLWDIKYPQFAIVATPKVG